MRDFDHPNVMKFLGMCFDAPEGYPYIILPFMVDGSLLDYLKRRTSHSNITSADGYPEVCIHPMCVCFFASLGVWLTYYVCILARMQGQRIHNMVL